MSNSTMLVDPLAALFEPPPAGAPPLLLDATEVEVELLPPLARVTITRRFTNASDQLLEAVLTLPPAARHEVVHGLTVTIDGAEYHALARDRERSDLADGAAIAERRRAILYELLADDVQLISVSGVEAGAQVAVRIESIRPLDRPDEATAALTIALTADSGPINRRLADSDVLLTTSARHPATLSVIADGLTVGLVVLERMIALGRSIPIDCALPVSLRIAPFGERSLDHSVFHVEAPGGWEASSDARLETFRHPLNPGGGATSDRTDWIFGHLGIRTGRLRVTAPSPLSDDGRLRPDARAMAAFAAANFMESGAPCEGDMLRLAANILTRRNSLVFVGREGELPDAIPTLRKLALPLDVLVDSAADVPPEKRTDILAPPPPKPEPEPVAGPPLPIHPGPHITPGGAGREAGARAPGYRWLTWWGPAALSALWVAGAIQLVRIPLSPVMAAWVVLMLLNAFRFFPREGSPARRRLPLLLMLALPWIASIVVGPLGLADGNGDAARQSLLIQFQQGLLVGGLALPLILTPFMGDARRFTLTVGLLNLVITFLTTSASMVGPGS